MTDDEDLSTDSAAPRDRGITKRNELTKHIEAGRKAFSLKRDSSYKAAAHSFLVWQLSAPMSAPQADRRWLRKEIDDINVAIKPYNDELKARRKDGKAALAGKLSEDDLRSRGASNPKTERDEMIELALLDDKAFKKLLKVKLTVPPEGKEVGIHAVLRYVFDLYFPDDAPTISDYALVLKAINDALGGTPGLNETMIVDWLKPRKFKGVLKAQRKKRQSQKSNGPNPQDKGTGGTGDGDPPEEASPSLAPTLAANTVTWTLRVPPELSEMPDRPFTVHLKRLGDEEAQVISFSWLDTEEADKLAADFVKAQADARAPAEPVQGDGTPLPEVASPPTTASEEPSAHDANG